jgi:hypothetical protein
MLGAQQYVQPQQQAVVGADFGEIGHRFRSKPATSSAKSATPGGVGGAAPSLCQFSSS